MATAWIDVCAVDDLVEGGEGVRFAWGTSGEGGRPVPAFVVRFEGQPRAYLNRCAHVAMELDWLPGRFFDDAGLYLVCATHGAMYEPDSGLCVAGPCRGAALEALRCEEIGGRVRVAAEPPSGR
ncbi:MAG: Rieske 2Fe-2S domain-containing protein [Burkholderiaceae bacterium]